MKDFISNLCFYANNTKFSFSHYNNDHDEHYDYPPIDDFTELDIVKMLMHFKTINIQIEDEQLIIKIYQK